MPRIRYKIGDYVKDLNENIHIVIELSYGEFKFNRGHRRYPVVRLANNPSAYHFNNLIKLSKLELALRNLINQG